MWVGVLGNSSDRRGGWNNYLDSKSAESELSQERKTIIKNVFWDGMQNFKL